MFLSDKRMWRRITLYVCLLTFPYLSGMLDAVDRAVALGEPPASEGVAYELGGGAWATVIADEHGRDALRLFEWVRGSVTYEAYGGSRRGGYGTYLAGRGNDVDKASLLGTLLTAAEISWRYAQGDVRLSAADAASWLGVSDVAAAARVLKAGGVRFDALPSVQDARYIVLRDHVWVQVRSDYLPAAGSALDDSGLSGTTAKDPAEQWIDLDTAVTFREVRAPLDLASLTGVSSSEVRGLIEGAAELVDSVLLRNLPGEVVKGKARQAGDRFEARLKKEGLDLGARLRDAGPLTLPKRDVLPGNLPGDVVGRVRTVAPDDDSAVVDFLQGRRDRVTISLKDDVRTFTWTELGVAKTAGRSLDLSFRVVKPEDAPDHTTTSGGGAIVPLVVEQDADGDGANDNICRVEPVLSLGNQAVGSPSMAPQYAYGKTLELEIRFSGDGGVYTLTDVLPVTAGGFYSVSLLDVLSERGIATLKSSFEGTGSEQGRWRTLSRSLFLAGQTALHQRSEFEVVGLGALGYGAGRTGVRGVVAGLEPAVAGASARGVRLITHGFGAGVVPVEWAPRPLVGTAAATRLGMLAEDVALVGPMLALAGHEGYQSPGRVMALLKGEAAQEYRLCAKGADVASLPSGALPGNSTSLATSLQDALQSGGVVLSDTGLLLSETETYGLQPGFAYIPAVGGTAEARAVAAEDGRVLSAWSPVMVAGQEGAPMEHTALSPMDLVTPSNLVEPPLASGDLLKNRAKDWLGNVGGVTESMLPAMASATLLAGPWLEQGSWQPGIPSACFVFHETAATFTRPRVLEFTVEPSLIATKSDRVDALTGAPIAATPLIAKITASRTAETLKAEFFDDALFGATGGVGPYVVASNERLLEDTFDATNMRLLLETSGSYEVRGFAELAGGVRSEYERRQIEVDNDAPTVTLLPVTETTTGVFDLKGSIADKNLSSWQVYWRPASGSGSWTALSGYSGTYQLAGSGQVIASIDSKALGWNGSLRLAVVAEDKARNQTLAETTITFENDSWKPQVTLTGTIAGGAPLADGGTLYGDETTLNFTASDDPTPKVSGLRLAKLWAESQSDPTRVLVLYDAKFNPPAMGSVPTPATPITLSTKSLPRTSPVEKWTVRAEARDDAGNREEKAIRNLSVGDLIWDFSVSPGAISKGGKGWTELKCQMSTPATWAYEIRQIDVATGQALPPILWSSTSNGIEQTLGIDYWYGVKSGDSREAVPSGVYEVTVRVNKTSRPEEVRKARVTVVPTSFDAADTAPRLVRIDKLGQDNLPANDGVSYLEIPDGSSRGDVMTDLVIRKGSGEKLQITGRLGTFAIASLDGSTKGDELPTYKYPFGYSDAFWAVEFKSAGAFPAMEDILANRQDGVTITNRDNWIPVRWETGPITPPGCPAPYNTSREACLGNQPVVLAEWNASELPLGYYDLRLWVTNGLLSVHHVVGGFKVVPAESGTTDGPGIENVGALTLSSTDLTVPFSGYSAQIARDYNSRDVYNDGPLGYGWKMRGLNLKVETYGISGDEDDEAFITLPDGREFWFANMPPKQDVAGGFNASAQNRWINYGEYLQRPYGMRLFRPGASNWFHNSGPFSAMRVAGDGYQMGAGAGARRIPLNTYVDPENNNAEPYGPGDVAYLQTEDKTWYIFVWETGDLIEMIHPDGQIIRFERNTAEQANPATGLTRTMVVRDTAGKTMTILRDTTTGRIEQVLDPNNQPVKYSYDPHGNLREVIDRRGFRRFYVYDTPTDRDFFKRNFPNEMAKFTGRNLHRLVDVRIDDDSDALMHFEGDTFPPAANANGDLRVYTQQLLGSQQWPGDRSILTFKYDGNDDVVAYETSAGNVDLSYSRDENGGTVDIVQRESQGRQRVTYDKDGRVTEKVDLYGAKSINNYGVADFGDNGSISGVLTSEENALHQVTAYEYEGPTQRGPGSFSEIFQGFLDSKLSGECPTLYGDCNGDYFPQNAPGYLTGAQLRPSIIRQQGANGFGGDDIVTAIDYQMNGDEPAAFQPLKLVDPLRYTGNIQGDVGTALAYSPKGRMTTITPLGDPANAVTTEYYGDVTMDDPVYAGEADAAFQGRIRRTTAPQGLITEYGYRLSPGAGAWVEEHAAKFVAPDQPTRYSYARLDALGRSVETWSSAKSPAQGYDLPVNQEERIVTQFDPDGNVVYAKSDDGTATSNFYDWKGRLVRSVSTPGLADSQRGGSAESIITIHDYDDLGRKSLVKIIKLPAGQADESRGRVLTRTEYLYQELPLGRTADQPLLGRLETVKDLRGGRTETQYDKGSRVVATRRYLPDGTLAAESSSEYDLLGRQIKTTDERGNTTERVYDGFGRISQTKRNGTIVAKYGYDKGGRQIWSWAQVGGYTVNKYDADGRVIEVYVNQTDSAIESLTSTNSYTSTEKLVYTYEQAGAGRRIAETDQEGRTTRTYYDAQGRVTAIAMAFVGDVSAPNPPAPDLVADPTGATNAVFKFGYDAEGRQNRIEKPLGGVTEKFYDAEGRLEYEFGPINSDSSTGPGTNRREVKLVVYLNDGQVEREKRGTASNGSGVPATRDLQFDEEIVYTYDSDFGGVATKSLLRNGTLQRTETYSYGREHGELIAVKVEEGGGYRTTGYSYDANGNLDMVTSPEGWTIYERDALGDLRRIRTSTGIDTVYTYTNRGKIKSISDRGLATESDETGTVSYGYDDFGRKESITRPNGTTSEYTYDPLTGWTDSITHRRGGTVLLALGYDRDKTGLITDITESRPAGEQSGAWHYDYDALKRLSGATWTPSNSAATEYGYTYDRNGNRLSESVTGSATKYSRYNKLDQLLDERTSAAYPGGTIEKSYTWDTHGRLASETASIASASRVYTWSVDDRLESVQLGANPTDPTVRYTYDHEGRLIKREKGQDVARFLVDNDNPTGYSQALSEVNSDATKVTENYHYGDDFGPLAQVHNPSAVGFDQRFLYGDHLSTTRLLTTSLSSDQYSYYSPYGAITQPAGGSSLTSYAFTGQSRDLDTGLQQHRARWLSAGMGRWLSEDSEFDFPRNSGNGFAYCGQSPVNHTDPLGSMTFGETVLVAGVVSGLTGIAFMEIKAYRDGTLASITWRDVLKEFVEGFIIGVISETLGAGMVAIAGAAKLAPLVRALGIRFAGRLAWLRNPLIRQWCCALLMGIVGAFMAAVDYITELAVKDIEVDAGIDEKDPEGGFYWNEMALRLFVAFIVGFAFGLAERSIVSFNLRNLSAISRIAKEVADNPAFKRKFRRWVNEYLIGKGDRGLNYLSHYLRVFQSGGGGTEQAMSAWVESIEQIGRSDWIRGDSKLFMEMFLDEFQNFRTYYQELMEIVTTSVTNEVAEGVIDLNIVRQRAEEQVDEAIAIPRNEVPQISAAD